VAAYYNEFKPEAAHMLRQLIRDGLIADGEVDERSITEVSSGDIKGFTQHHFFAGIGGWSVALRLAMWPDDRPVWTGSCPCQPFSVAGKQKGKDDERHLWPVWFGLIRESKPNIVFGEQVSSAIRHGWWDDVADDLEREGYTTRAEIRPACSVGSPHKRDRLWFVGNAEHNGHTTSEKPRSLTQGSHNNKAESKQAIESARPVSELASMANTIDLGQQGCISQEIQWQPREPWESERSFANWNNGWPISSSKICGVVDGIHGRTPLLHAFGNAIVPQVAAEFIEAVKIVVDTPKSIPYNTPTGKGIIPA